MEKLRVRKKPDLRINIPSYPSDYVEMPPETREKIAAAMRNSAIPYIDDDITPGSSSDGYREETRTPEVRISEDEGKNEEKIADKEDKSTPTESTKKRVTVS